MDHGLYVVATPIGNLQDITIRALDVLERADVIAAEDTRITRRLLDRYGIETPVTPYHDHNAAAVRPGLVKRLQDGDIVALVSDAGTPLISDPGYKLVEAASEAGVRVIPVPGPSALTAAISAAALPTDRFLFLGFLPPKTEARRAALEAVRGVNASLVLYDTPNRLAALLTDAAAVLGDRPAAVCREVTKKFEDIRRGPLRALAAWAETDATLKGELAVVIGPPHAETDSDADVDRALRAALETHTVKDAVALVAGATGTPRKTVYQRALALTGGR